MVMGFWSRDEIKTESGITIKDRPADRPAFARIYTARLDDRAAIKITARTSPYGSRYHSGELTQPNGRWILFDPDRIADKIIDPLLVPLVQRYVDEILAIDRAFIKSDPAEYVDDRGVKWRRVEQ